MEPEMDEEGPVPAIANRLASRFVVHRIVGERPVDSRGGSGYLITCSCGQVIEVPPDPLTSLTAARAHARHEWGRHQDLAE